MRKKIYFRADAGAEIGYGHFIRSLALADMLKSDFECVMFTQEPTLYQVAEAERVCQLVSLPADESKFDGFLTYLTGEEIVVLDNYFYSTAYQKQIKEKGCKLVCIDDVHDKHFSADVVINHSVGLTCDLYDVEPQTRVCLGADYLLLRRPFRMAAAVDHKQIATIHRYFVCFGGSDEYDLTSRTIRIILDQDSNNTVVAVVGDSYPGNVAQTVDTYGERVCFAKNLSAEQMCDLMQSADAAVVPASSVFFEACCMRLPLISGYFVDNQMGVARETEKLGLCIGLGDMNDDFENKFIQALYRLPNYADTIVRNQCRIINNSEFKLKQIFMDLSREDYIKVPMSREEFLDKLVETLDLRKNPFHPMVFINGPEFCEFGENVYIGYLSEVNAKGSKVIIKDNCDIAGFVAINVADSHKRCIGLSDAIDRGPITLEQNVFVGSHCFIGKNTHIGHHSIVAAGTIIIDGGEIPPYSLIKGNPAKVYPGVLKVKIEKF